ncbi:MAG: DUF1080 domain-containing protein, partial [Balneolales bacterium]
KACGVCCIACIFMIGLQETISAQDVAEGNSIIHTHYITPGFEPIFNGKDINNWDFDSRFWRVENGVIIGETSVDNPTEANTFLIWEGGEPADFEITFYYRLVVVSESGYGNSGIQIRSERFHSEDTPELLHRVRGIQPDISINGWTGALYEEGGRGALARRGQRVVINEDGESKQERFAEIEDLAEDIAFTGEWNKYHIYAKDNTIQTWINGKLMHQVIDNAPDARQEGVLAFQLHAGDPMRVEFRNIELKPLH